MRIPLLTPTHRRRLLAITVPALLLTAGATAFPAAAHAASTDVVISSVYGGGGNSGATYTNDFIQLENRGSAPVDVSGWSVQYASATGTTWQVTPLTGTIAPGARYLVAEAAGAGGTTPLPTPDVTGTIPMSATSGKVALVRTATALPCGASCVGDPSVHDFVGYGTANEAETSPTPTLSNTIAALRTSAPDSDDNAADFTVGPPAPGGGSEPPVGQPATIAEIQGRAHLSPLAGKPVTEVEGVVTAVTARSFWMQDPTPDADPVTSDGVLVFTSSAPTVAVGDAVRVAGTVTEFRPGGATTANLTTTEITAPTVEITASGAPLPAPVLLGPGGRTAPPAIRTDAPGDVEASPVFDPAVNALDFYESLEGTLVRVTDAVAVGPTASFGEIPVLPGGVGSPRTVRGGIRYTYADPNTERVILDDLIAPLPAVDVSDRLPGPVDAVVDYSFSNFKLEVLATPAVASANLPRETTRRRLPIELAVGTFNVENLDPGDPQAKFDRLAATIVVNLARPDILAVEEIQDDTGPTNDGTVTAGVTYGRLVDAVVAAGGPRYAFRQVDPENNADGGEPGGNIRVGFLFDPARVTFVDRPGATATTSTDVVRQGRRAALTLSPGRVDPTDPAFEDSRKPLAGEFRFRGATVIVVANHFASKGGDEPLFGRFQPPQRLSEVQRTAQARVVRGFVDEVLAVDRSANIIVLGDLNDFEFSPTVDILTAGGALLDLPRTLPANQRYTYVFEGNSQVLDHILLSRGLSRQVGPVRQYDYDIVHVNAEFADQDSDHDPQVVRVVPLPGT